MRTFLDIPPGIIADETATIVGQAAWADGNCVRFYQGSWETVGGWEKVIADTLTGVCRTVLPWTDTVGALNVAFGTHSALQLYRGGELFTITPAGLAAGAEHGTGTAGYGTGTYGAGGYSEPSTDAYYARTWALDTYGESLMANPRGGTIYQWLNDTGDLAEPLTGAPAAVNYMICTEQRQVMAFGCNEEVSADFNPLCIRFSDIENPEDWTTTPSNNAGEVILRGGGRLVGAERIGQYVLTWTDNSLHLGTFVGDPSQTWRFDLVGERCGLMGPNASVIVGQTAFWAAPNGEFYTYTLGGAPVPLPCTVQRDFIDNLSPSQLDKVVASSCQSFSEVRFDYPDARDGYENSRYVVVSLGQRPVWSRGIMARSAYVDAGPSVSPIGVSPDGSVYWHERGHTADGSALSWFIKSADQYLDGQQRCMRINDVEPDFKAQQGPVCMVVSTKEYPQETAEAWDSILLAPGETYQDFRAEGRFVSVQFEGDAVPSFARGGRISFDVMQTGRR